jgi:hypothetical protein
MNSQKRALSAAKRCHKELINMLRESRESFEVWKAFAGVTLDVEFAKMRWFCPLVSAMVDAHFLRTVINLFIIGDANKKGYGEGHGVYYLRRKLKGSGLLGDEQDCEWQKQLDNAKPCHVKIRLVRDKFLAHRDKDYTWAKAIQESGLSYEELDILISLYYRIAEDCAPILNPMFLNENIVKTTMTRSIQNTKKALLQYQPVLSAEDNQRLRNENSNFSSR